jgi:hypothetical protein
MVDYSSAWLLWLLTEAVCVAPAIVAAIFGRGGFVIAAALCSAVTFLLNFAMIGLFVWGKPQIAVHSFWAAHLAIPFGIAVCAAIIAVYEKHRQRSDGTTKQ